MFYNEDAKWGGFDTRIHVSERKRGVLYWKQSTCKTNGYKRIRLDVTKGYAIMKRGCEA